MNDKYRVKCVGEVFWDRTTGVMSGRRPGCGWVGIRTDHIQCECYDMYAVYCRPLTPGPGCPRGIDWACPKCRGSVTGKIVQHRSKTV